MTTAVIVAASIAAAAVAGGQTLATVDGVAITTADVAAAYGDKLSGNELKDAVEGLIARRLILARAQRRGLTATPAEVARAYALALRAYAPNNTSSPESFKKRLAEEITVAKYVEAYVLPRVDAGDENLRVYFLDHITRYQKKPPADAASRNELFGKHRNEVAYDFLRAEITRLLEEEGKSARTSSVIRLNLP